MHAHGRILVAEPARVRPVDRRVHPVEKPRLGDQEQARTGRTDRRPRPVPFRDPSGKAGRASADPAAVAHEQRRHDDQVAGPFLGRPVQRQGDAAGKPHRAVRLSQQLDLKGGIGGDALVSRKPGEAVQNVEDAAERGKACLGDGDNAHANRP